MMEPHLKDETKETMQVTVNGDPMELPQGITVTDLVQQLKLKPELVVVELNLNILKREQLAQAALKAGDQVEIVHFVGGGALNVCDRLPRSEWPGDAPLGTPQRGVPRSDIRPRSSHRFLDAGDTMPARPPDGALPGHLVAGSSFCRSFLIAAILLILFGSPFGYAEERRQEPVPTLSEGDLVEVVGTVSDEKGDVIVFPGGSAKLTGIFGVPDEWVSNTSYYKGGMVKIIGTWHYPDNKFIEQFRHEEEEAARKRGLSPVDVYMSESQEAQPAFYTHIEVKKIELLTPDSQQKPSVRVIKKAGKTE